MKKYLKITILLIMLLAITTSTVSATYQVKPGADSTTGISSDNFFYNIRKMEAEGQVLGLTETINATTGVASTSNNLDCHMMKNTEYGLIAIFSASGFGDVPTGYGTTANGGDETSTTKNKTGIYQMVNYYGTAGSNEKWEYVAAVHSNIGNNNTCPNLRNNVDKRYVDIYSGGASETDYSSAKVGDATRETVKWYGATGASFVWRTTKAYSSVFLRGANGLFSFASGIRRTISFPHFSSSCSLWLRTVA